MSSNQIIQIQSIPLSNAHPFVLIAGPCAIEGEDFIMRHAEAILKITNDLQIPFIFKSSFDKANRTSGESKRGIGMEKGLEILRKVKQKFHIPVITDVHETWQCTIVADCVDILQIPAFLSRQTDLLQSAACTKKPIMIKKGQFSAPEDMKYPVEKIQNQGNNQVILCERGTSFGYHQLINDMRSIPIMANTTHQPIVFDATHSVQMPAGQGKETGGQRQFIPYLARSAITLGIAGLFLEVHEHPEQATSDASVQLRLNKLYDLLAPLKDLDHFAKTHPLMMENWI